MPGEFGCCRAGSCRSAAPRGGPGMGSVVLEAVWAVQVGLHRESNLSENHRHKGIVGSTSFTVSRMSVFRNRSKCDILQLRICSVGLLVHM